MTVSASPTSTSENGTSDSDSDGLVSKSRGTKSAVWIYFGFEADVEGRPKVQDAVICRLCKKPVSVKSGNTSNLLSHLKVHHPQRHSEVKKANSKPSGKDKDHARQEVAACIYWYTVMLLSYQIPILNFPYCPTLVAMKLII